MHIKTIIMTLFLIPIHLIALSCNDVTNGGEYPSLYKKLICSAEKNMNHKEYIRAIKLYTKALQIDLEDQANYEPYENIAKALCQANNINQAKVYIEDYRCMLKVDANMETCYNDMDVKSVQNSVLTQRCFDVMCKTNFHNDYTLSSQLALELITVKLNELQKIEGSCK